MSLILYAIPFFSLLILLEIAYGLACANNTYRVNDSINSLSMGSLSRLQSLVILGFSGSLYEYITDAHQLAQLADDSIWVWFVCFMFYDFAYYWKHRLGHELALFWGSHVAHHQSEDFNLSTALRQTSIDFHGFLFYLPFFFLGFPAEVLYTVVSLNLIYQFWVHTEHIPKLGLLEWVFVTPSNHRVHHARNKIYVDRNYGGVFIVWDRLFGSFQEELSDERVVFGLRKPLNSWNPLWANVHVYWRLLQDFQQMPGLTNKIKLLLKPPGWRSEGIVSNCKLDKGKVLPNSRFDPQISRFNRNYSLVQFVLTVALSSAVLLSASNLSYGVISTIVFYLCFSFYTHGAWLEDDKNARILEIVRLVFLIPCLLLLGISVTLTWVFLVNTAIALPVLLISGKRQLQSLAAN